MLPIIYFIIYFNMQMYLQHKAFLSFLFYIYKLIYDLFTLKSQVCNFWINSMKITQENNQNLFFMSYFYINNYLTNMLSKKAYKYTDPIAYQKGHKTNEKTNAFHTSTRNQRSSEVSQGKQQENLSRNIERGNKSNENKNTEKQLYKLHYTPKLTSFMLADSNMVQKQEQNEEVSEKYEYKKNNQESKYKKNQCLYTNQAKKQPHGAHNSNFLEQTQTLVAVSDNIRSFVQEFIYSIKDDQSMSVRLEHAVQNLLMRMLNVATLINGMAKYYSPNSYQKTNSTQQQKNERVYKKCKQINRKSPIKPIQQCIRIEDSQLSKYSSQQAKYKYSQRDMETINNASRQLPILCEDPSAEDLLSSCREPYYADHDQYSQKYEDNESVSDNMSQSDKQSNKGYGYSNFVDNLFTKQKNPKQKESCQENNSFLKNKYKFNHQYRQPYPTDDHSDISKQESSSKQAYQSSQQSIIQSQSDVGIEEGAYSSSIHLCPLQARSNNYHSSYNFKKAKNNSHTKQSHEKYAQDKQDKDQMMQNSISEYYIQQSPININKNSMSKNVSEIKSKHNHSPISYTYQQYSPIPKSQKNKSHSSSNIVTNTNINKSNKYNKQNKSPFNYLKSGNKDLEGNPDSKNVSPNSNNYCSYYNSKQKHKRYSDIYSNNRVSLGSINPTNVSNNTNSSESFNHLFGNKGTPNPSSHVTTNTQGYIVSQVLSRRKIF